MNYMKDIAALLGVELNEEFNLIGEKRTYPEPLYRLTTNGLEIYCNDVWKTDNANLPNLLKGYWQIQRLPFKPKLNETYWTLDYILKNEITTVEYVWKYWTYDYLAYYNGLCFRTKEEAEANKDKLLKIINHYNKED